MKRIFNLMYCDGLLTTQVVHYYVFVGKSKREQKACAAITKMAAGTNNLYFAVNDATGARFMEMIRESLKQKLPDGSFAFSTMRCFPISVTAMWKMLRELPLPLLNSTKILTRSVPLHA